MTANTRGGKPGRDPAKASTMVAMVVFASDPRAIAMEE
jgi:hypothetical protein